MSAITIRTDIELDSPYMVEGLPGTGLVAKISADHLIERLDMELYAEVYGKEIPRVAIFEGGEYAIRPAVRIFVDRETQLLVLKSEAPVSAYADEFVGQVCDWIQANDITPVFQIGVPAVREDEPSLFGVAIGETTEATLQEIGVTPPPGMGWISGPTGGLLFEAMKREMPAIGLVVESYPQRPDPAASKVLVDQGVEKILGIDIDTKGLVEAADKIREQEQLLIERLQQAEEEEASQAYPEDIYG